MPVNGGRGTRLELDQTTLLVVGALGVGIWWYMRKQGRPAVLDEVVIGLRNLADARHEKVGAKYRGMAEAIQDARGYVARGEKPQGDDYARIRKGVSEATNFDILQEAGFLHASGRSNKARDALFDLWQRIEP